MLLFSRANATAVDDPEYGHFDPDPETGAFDLPDDFADRLHRFHVRGKAAWETETEREDRLHSAESARRRDPETLYNAVADIANITKQLAGLQLASQGAAPAGSEAAVSPAEGTGSPRTKAAAGRAGK